MRLWTRAVLAGISGELIVEAHVGWAPLALVALAPWLWALIAPPDADQADARGRLPLVHAAALSALPYLIGALHMWGLTEFGPLAHRANLVYLPLAGVAFALLARPAVWTHRPALQTLLIAAAWTLASASRGASAYGFPALLGATLVELPPLAQLAALAGPWGLDALVGATAALLALSLHRALEASSHGQPRWRRVARPLGVAAGLVAAVALAGSARLATAPVTLNPPPSAPAWEIALVQTGTPNWAHRRGWTWHRVQQAIDANVAALIQRAAAPAQGPPPDWIIAPESALGRAFSPTPRALDELAALWPEPWPGDPYVVMTLTLQSDAIDPTRPQADREDAALALAWDSAQAAPRLLGRASKRLLVPLVEPRYHVGPPWQPLSTDRGALGVMICYESLFPHVAAALADGGSDLLVVATNDAGQRWSDAGVWHARLGKLRALETGLPLVHASQGGPSFIVGPYGRQTPSTGLFEQRVERVRLARHAAPTPYRTLGRGWLALAALVWAFASARAWRLRSNPTSPAP